MSSHQKLLYLLTDGGRARLVQRSAATGHYATLEEIDGGDRLRTLRRELRTSPPARTFRAGSPPASGTREEDFYRPAKEAFVAEVADRALAVMQRERMDGVFLAAPPRLLGPLKASIDGRAPLAGALRKDLTKAPDQELGAWLDDALKSPQLSF